MGQEGNQKRICPICGHSIPKSYSFCMNCGEKYADVNWTCNQCDKNIAYGGYDYCIYCGSERRVAKEVKTVLPIGPELSSEKPERATETTPTIFCPSGYTIIERIGSGGFGDVYKAKDPSGRIVALKIPRIETTETIDKSCFERFINEAKIWSKLIQEAKKQGFEVNIVQVYEYGSTPLPWVSIEFMEGGSLEGRLRKGPLPLKESLHIAVKIAEAIEFAHHYGVVHQDIKPQNILFTRNGVPKLTDWGLGKVLLDFSLSGKVFEGTVACAAPEQLDSERFGRVDWRTDIYGFGVVLYWMLAGEPPFSAKDFTGYIKKITEENFKALHQVNPSIPTELDAILEKTLAKRKEDRYEAMVLARKDLKELLISLK